MFVLHLLPSLLLLFFRLSGVYALLSEEVHPRANVATTCAQIESAISSASSVYYPASIQWTQDILHWASNAAQSSACSVEPGSVQDVAIIMQILASTQTPFAVKGGGHSPNIGFSSTTGVQIAMSRFSDVNYDAASGTAEIGAGLIWDDVYDALTPQGVNVIGGRVTGVGVAGFTLGGGYSWKTNQYGLTIDSMVSYELVLPNGTIVYPSATSYPDLFWALKGAGQVNFGIVTQFTMKAYPQTDVWGGSITYPVTELNAVANAIIQFNSQNTDPKASILPTFGVTLDLPIAIVILFYDAPTPPTGTFDAFFNVPWVYYDLSTQPYGDMVRSTPSNLTMYNRLAFNTAPVYNLSSAVLAQVINQTIYYGDTDTLLGELLDGSWYFSIDVEPFLPSAFTNNNQGGSYPHEDALLPICFTFSWESSLDDSFWMNAIQDSANIVTQTAIAEGQPLTGAEMIKYNNYAPANTPLDQLYGSNLARLQSIKAQYDPNNVMGLTGGFKL
ncbi:FAD-binding domain-containing protein [Dacryopinax primogenitus]|uniref:FAD-binding domain-containing protein n=1 Tax=Dacryopinax primogenitus (strain DJM 731) TaxID=1858805 RepID=M5FT40_DACPD|nr:FAD-binding domain-containing protein [Dacryopinax primogenitus]EJT99163.1 FAD-binding domain-containing protein [Dacryopinax primogenitus]